MHFALKKKVLHLHWKNVCTFRVTTRSFWSSTSFSRLWCPRLSPKAWKWCAWSMGKSGFWTRSISYRWGLLIYQRPLDRLNSRKAIFRTSLTPAITKTTLAQCPIAGSTILATWKKTSGTPFTPGNCFYFIAAKESDVLAHKNDLASLCCVLFKAIHL